MTWITVCSRKTENVENERWCWAHSQPTWPAWVLQSFIRCSSIQELSGQPRNQQHQPLLPLQDLDAVSRELMFFPFWISFRQRLVACQVGGGAAAAAKPVVPARSLSSSFIPTSCRCTWKACNLSRCGGEVPQLQVCFPALRLTWRILRHGVLWLDGTN